MAFRRPARSMVSALEPVLWLVLIAMLSGTLVQVVCGRAETAAVNRVGVRMRTPHGGFNRVIVQVTVCAPGTSRCATVDDVMIDTGSTGLRLEAAAVPSWLHLPTFLGPNGKPLAECVRFVADEAWGPLVRADLHIGGLSAADLPIQVIDDGSQPQPRSCLHSEVQPTSNGTLGIGPDLLDCRGPCLQNQEYPGVYSCDTAGCVPIEGAVEPRYRLPNPVSLFPAHNNGIVIDFPPAPPLAAAEVTGSLTFGVGTAENNRMGAAALVRLDANGHFTTLYGGARYPGSYIDSGTETYIVPDDRLPRCDGIASAFCVSPRRQRDAILVGQDGTHVPAQFWVGDYKNVRAQGYGASDSMAVAADPFSKAFVWGAPFFPGKRVFVVIDGKSVPTTSGITGPLYGFVSHGEP